MEKKYGTSFDAFIDQQKGAAAVAAAPVEQPPASAPTSTFDTGAFLTWA